MNTGPDAWRRCFSVRSWGPAVGLKQGLHLRRFRVAVCYGVRPQQCARCRKKKLRTKVTSLTHCCGVSYALLRSVVRGSGAVLRLVKMGLTQCCGVLRCACKITLYNIYIYIYIYIVSVCLCVRVCLYVYIYI